MKFKPNIKLLTSKIIFIGGVTRSGKSFLCPIVSSFKNCEMFFMNSFAENITYIDNLKGINKNYSNFLIKLIFNEVIYNMNIGRNLNQRRSDYTSINKFKNSKIYLKRMKGPEGDTIVKKIKKNKNLYPVMFHDVLINPKLLLGSFKQSKIIFVDRHPVDLIDEWTRKKYSADFFANPRNVTLSFDFKGKNYPHWCLKHFRNISKTKNIYKKTIISLSALILKQKSVFKKLEKNYKKRIKIIKFDNLINDTDKEINKISKFVKTKISLHTKKEIEKQGGNRKINKNLREYLKKKILAKIDKKTKNLLENLELSYNKD
jgi:hypothetical protein